MDPLPTVPLAELKAGTHAVVRAFRGGRELVNRLTALGLIAGVSLEVLQNYGRGPLLVLVRDTRIALGRGEALKVLVEQGS